LLIISSVNNLARLPNRGASRHNALKYKHGLPRLPCQRFIAFSPVFPQKIIFYLIGAPPPSGSLAAILFPRKRRKEFLLFIALSCAASARLTMPLFSLEPVQELPLPLPTTEAETEALPVP